MSELAKTENKTNDNTNEKDDDKNKSIRVVKFRLNLSRSARKRITLLRWAALAITNDLIRHIRYTKANQYRACEVVLASGKSCRLAKWDDQQNRWVETSNEERKTKTDRNALTGRMQGRRGTCRDIVLVHGSKSM